MSYIWQTNREMFEPFVEDEVPFDDYCRSMGEDGTWAGNMELQAASLVTRCNICIHKVCFEEFNLISFCTTPSNNLDCRLIPILFNYLNSICLRVGIYKISISMKLG